MNKKAIMLACFILMGSLTAVSISFVSPTPANGSSTIINLTVNASMDFAATTCNLNVSNTSGIAANIFEGHGYPFVTNNPNYDGNPSGMKISVGSIPLNLTTITKSVLCDGTFARVRDGGMTTLASASFSGVNASISYVLEANTIYYVTVDGGGSDFSHGKNTSASYPVVETYFNWTAGRFSNADKATEAWDIVGIAFNVAVPASQNIYSMAITNSGSNSSAIATATGLTLGSYRNYTVTCSNATSSITTGQNLVYINSSTPSISLITANNTAFNKNLTVSASISTTSFKNCSFFANGIYYAGTQNGSACYAVLSNLEGDIYVNASLYDLLDKVAYSETFVYHGVASLYDCTLTPLTPILNFSFFSQDAVSTPISSTMQATFTLRSQYGESNTSFNWNVSRTFQTVCLNVSSGTYYIDGTQTFTAEGYRPLFYYLNNQTISVPSMENVSLYNLNESTSVATEYLILTGASEPVQNAYIQIQRYYPGTNQLLLVSMGKTNTNGIANSYAMANDVIYRYVVIEGYHITFTSGTATIPCDPISTICSTTIYVGEGVQNEYAAYIDAVGVGCFYNVSNSVVYCTSNNPGGTETNLNLKLYELGTYTNTLICEQNLHAAGGTVICNVPNTTKAYYYVGSATVGSEYIIGQGSINLKFVEAVDGSVGLFFTMLMVVGMGLTGMTVGFAGAIMGALIGLILAVLLKMITIAIEYLVVIVVVGVVLAWLLRG